MVNEWFEEADDEADDEEDDEEDEEYYDDLEYEKRFEVFSQHVDNRIRMGLEANQGKMPAFQVRTQNIRKADLPRYSLLIGFFQKRLIDWPLLDVFFWYNPSTEAFLQVAMPLEVIAEAEGSLLKAERHFGGLVSQLVAHPGLMAFPSQFDQQHPQAPFCIFSWGYTAYTVIAKHPYYVGLYHMGKFQKHWHYPFIQSYLVRHLHMISYILNDIFELLTVTDLVSLPP